MQSIVRTRPGAALLMAAGALACFAPGAAPAEEKARFEALGGALIAAAEHERAAHRAPSMAIGIVGRDGLVWSGAVGHADASGERAADAHTLYRIGSISKLFTDLLVMQEVERGRLDLDAPVSRYLPDFAPRNPFGGAITLRQLMSHRSGLVREPPVGSYFDAQAPSLAQTVRSLNATTLVAKPGTLTKYSNAGLAVVGRVLEVMSDEPFEVLMSERLLAPLGMQGSAPMATPEVRRRLAHALMVPFDAARFAAPVFDLGMAPAGNLYASVTDLAHFAAALLRGGESAHGRILSRETLERMWTPAPEESGLRRFGIGFALGTLDGHRVVGHGGAVYGFVTDLSVFPDDGFAVIVTIALDEASIPLARLRNYVARSYLAAMAGEPLPTYITSDAVPRALGRRIAGHYSDGAHSLHIRPLAGRVYLEAPGVAEELRRVGERWVLDGVASYRDDVKIDLDAGEVTLGSTRYRREPWKKPARPTAELAALIGEYGWEHNYLQVYERDARLQVRIEWNRYESLERVSADVYRFADPHGLYPHEALRFVRDADGRATAVDLNGIRFQRRDFGAEIEARIRATVQRAPQLRTSALAAKPPKSHAARAPDLLELIELAPDMLLDVRYASTNNFMGIPFYESARAFLQRPAAEALVRAHRRLAGHGYGIAVYDGYRPWYVTKMFWDATPPGGRDFVADPSQGSRHNRGCAADVSLFERESGRIVEMPGRYDEMSARSSPLYVGGSSLERWQRDLLREAVEAEGFDVYLNEWWHFDFREWPSYPIINLVFDEIAPAR